MIEDKKIVKYVDRCDTKNDTMLFEVKVSTQTYQELLSSPMEIINLLKLKVSETENYTCIDPTGKVKVYGSVFEIIDEYINVRLEYYNKRKQFNIDTQTNELKLLVSKCLFVKGVINDEIELRNKPINTIVSQIEKNEKIIKVDDSYDYLLRMPISSITKEKYTDLSNKIKQKKAELDAYRQQTIEELWKQDISTLEIK